MRSPRHALINAPVLLQACALVGLDLAWLGLDCVVGNTSSASLCCCCRAFYRVFPPRLLYPWVWLCGFAHAQLPHAASMASMAEAEADALRLHRVIWHCCACVRASAFSLSHSLSLSLCRSVCVLAYQLSLQRLPHARHIVAATLVLCYAKMLPVFVDALNLQHLAAHTRTYTHSSQQVACRKLCQAHTHTRLSWRFELLLKFVCLT